MSDALAISRAYYEAWAAKDFDRAMTYLAPDVVGLTPSGRLDGAEAFRGFMEPFTRIVTATGLVAAFGDDRTSVLLYDTATVPVPDAPGAECHTVVDGRITEIRIVFDRLPFAEAREARAAAG
ncbi:nuclear transport factor 2 family protein [Pseudonocardia endophytica]|uniref:Ketosteroid isomerase-like protein n=1 Tax=Pseudonocardia endophytica TaxID=401976 RepID=A0A4R1HFR5_PSEEN|nr:nuclear transport factor 2 family protein [Pseudonocardia endophytica]TCK20977.1 ketosteroid isomerase-like protein [Pseudonocardia endophytica]